jgi:hypothetical protein
MLTSLFTTVLSLGLAVAVARMTARRPAPVRRRSHR